MPCWIKLKNDPAGNRTSMATPAGTTTYSDDAQNRLKTVTLPPAITNKRVQCSYNPMGMLAQTTLPNDAVARYTYNNVNRLTSLVQTLEVTGQPVVALASYGYAYDNVGNRDDATETVNGTTLHIDWSYDNAYRLTSDVRRNAQNAVIRSTAYTYDNAGNRLMQTVDGVQTTYGYNANDQLTSASSPSEAITYQYDVRGNLASMVIDAAGSNPDSALTFTFDASDQLTAISGINEAQSLNITYGYDHDGHRIQENIGGTITNFLWDEFSTYGDVVLETNASGSITNSYVLAGEQLISQTSGTSTEYFLPDAQGSTRLLTDATGGVADRFFYTAFGELLKANGELVADVSVNSTSVDA